MAAAVLCGWGTLPDVLAVRFVPAAGQQIVGGDHGRRCSPGKRAADVDIEKTRTQAHADGKEYLPQSHHADQGEKHRHAGIAVAAQNSEVHLADGEEKVERDDGTHHCRPDLHHLWVGAEEGYAGDGEPVDEEAQSPSDAQPEQQAALDAAAARAQFPAPVF